MRDLIESVINNDLVDASHLFEQHMNHIVEMKLYEVKRSIALNERVEPTGEKDEDGNARFRGQNDKKDWAEYRKQHKAVKWDQNKEGKKVTEKPKATPLGHGGKLSANDIKVRRKAGYMQAHPAIKAFEFIQKVKKYKETGKLDESTPFVDRAVRTAQSIPNDNNAEPPRDPGNMAKGKKTTNKLKSRYSALRDVVRQNRGNDAEAAAQDKYQRHVNRKTVTSIKNIVKGQNVGANARNLLKYGGKSSAGKAAGAAARSVMSDFSI